MTAYADLDVSVIDELPPGRTPIRTVVLSEERRAEVVERIYNAVAEGAGTFMAISEHTGLSIATVKKLVTELEDWPGGPRIVRAKGQRHYFKALP